jgi:TPR repeat protein
MVRTAAIALGLTLTAPALAQPTPASLTVAPAAQELFERDWVLMNWALKFYDSNRDILLEPAEAHVAADEFRKIADADGDGRVTPQEYRAARAFILARY